MDRRPDRPVFIVGMERSGTSLLRSILNASASLAVAPETHFVNRWVPQWHRRDPADPLVFDEFWERFSVSGHFAKLQLDAHAAAQALRGADVSSWADVHIGLLRAFAAAHGKDRLGEKVPAYSCHIEMLFRWYPDARIIYSVREPRAVVASHLALDEPWARGTDYELIRKWRKRAAGALRWAGHPQVVVIRYEDLIAEEEATLIRICRFIDIPLEPDMLGGRRGGDTREGGSLDPASAVVPTQVEAWRGRISARQADLIAFGTRRQATALGYDVENTAGAAIRLRSAAAAVGFAAVAAPRKMRRAVSSARDEPRAGRSH